MACLSSGSPCRPIYCERAYGQRSLHRRLLPFLWSHRHPTRSLFQRSPDAKVGDLHLYRDSIVTAIRDNPGKRAKALATLLLDRYKVVRVQWDALRVYIEREDLYKVAASAPSTPKQSLPAPSSPIARDASPPPAARAMPTSNVKIADLPLYRDIIVAAIKANPGKRACALSTVLANDYALVVHWSALKTYCD